MHYYQFNIDDYRGATAHLSNEEDLAYRRLLDMYYDTEQKIPLDLAWVAKRLRVNTTTLNDVLNDMFERHEDGYFHARCDEVIKQFKDFAEAGKRGAAKRWAKETDSPPIAPLTGGVSYPNAKQETVNNKHKTRISDDFQVSDYVKDWAIKNKYDLRMVEKHKNYFIAACKSSAYEKESWDDFFIKSMMDNWGGFSNPKGGVVL